MLVLVQNFLFQNIIIGRGSKGRQNKSMMNVTKNYQESNYFQPKCAGLAQKCFVFLFCKVSAGSWSFPWAQLVGQGRGDTWAQVGRHFCPQGCSWIPPPSPLSLSQDQHCRQAAHFTEGKWFRITVINARKQWPGDTKLQLIKYQRRLSHSKYFHFSCSDLQLELNFFLIFFSFP